MRTITSLICLVTAGLLFFSSSVPAQEPPALPQLSVAGEAQLQVPADQMRLSLGVVTQGETVEAAMQENTVRLRKVQQTLLKAGLTDQELATGPFRVEPQWAPPPRQPAPDWRPQIVGYMVVNTLKIRTTRLDLAGRLIADATAAGANEVGNLVFDLADPRGHRSEAIRQATAHARADAGALAAAAGVRLVRVLSLNLDQAAAEPMRMVRFATAEMADSSTPVIAPGEVTVRAMVHMVYEVGPEEPLTRN